MKHVFSLGLILFAFILGSYAQIPTNGLVANYPFNGNTNDQTSNANNGTIIGGVSLTTDRFGRTDSAYSFDGSGHITIPDAISLKPASAVSTCAWVFLTDTSTWPQVVSKRYDTILDPWTSYGLGTNNWGTNTAWSFGVSNGTPGSLVFSDEATGILLNQWVFLVGTYDGTYVNLYVNGKLVRKEAQTGAIGYSTLPLTIGMAVSGQNFNGKIDDVLIYNRALDPCEIHEIYNIDLAGSLDLGEVVTNASCFGDNDGAIDLSISGGSENGCLGFDGIDDIITHGSNNRASNSFTMEAWFLATNTHEIDVESNTGTGGIDNQRYLFGPINTFVAGTATGGVSVGSNGISVYEHGPGYLPPVAVYTGSIGSSWNHVAVVYNNLLPSIYLNGVLVHTGIVGSVTTVYSPINIGAHVYGFFEGLIDEVRIWDKALSGAEVVANYTACSILPTDPNYNNLIGYWNMNEGSGNLINDGSGTGNLGQLSNGPVWYGRDSTQYGCASNFIQYQVNWSNGETTEDIDTLIAGTYTVTVTDGSGCAHVDSFTVTEPPLVVASAGVDTAICEGSNVQLNGSGGVTYAWSPGAGLSDSTISNPTANPLTTTTYTVTVLDAFGCSDSDILILTVNANPSPSISASGPIVFCDGDSVTLTSSAAVSYSWSSGDTIQSILIDTSGSYTVTVVDVNGCSGVSSSTDVTVNSNPMPTITASGATTFCAGDSVLLSSSNAATYLWSTGDTTQMINIDSSGSYSVTVIDSNSCSGTSGSTTVVANPNPISTISASAPTTFCQGDSVSLAASLANSYLWSTGDTTQNITTDTSGSYTVTVTDSLGCSTTSAAEIVTVNPLPAFSTVTTDVSSCSGSDGTIAFFATGGTSPYIYSIDGGVSFSFIDVFMGLNAGIYSVEVTDTNGCMAVGTTAIISSPSIPSAPTAGTNATYCEGDAISDLTASGSNIQWYSDSGLTTLVGNGSPFTPSSAVGSYTYYATQTVSGCESAGSLVTVDVFANPTPTISVTGNVLTTGVYSSYQWFVDGAILVAGTSQSYTATSSGGYWVTVTDSNGCTATTAIKTVTIISVDEFSMNFEITIYPNPNTGLFNLKIYANAPTDAQLQVFNLMGQTIYSNQLRIDGHHIQQIDLSGTATGVYYLKVIYSTGIITQKVIVE